MAGGRLIIPNADGIVDPLTGNPVTGATLTIYNTGTNTLANIYTTAAMNVALANPQTSAEGLFYAQATGIFADPSVAYDAVLAIPSGQTWTYETIWPVAAYPNFSGFLSNPNVTLTGAPQAPTPITSDNSSSIATTAFVQNYFAALTLLPAGMMAPFATQSVPAGWLTCDGSAVSRSTYGRLFQVISTTFGAGDGGTTFNLPNTQGQFVRGLDTGGSVDPGRAFGSTQTDQMQGFTVLFGTSQTNSGGVATPYSSGGDNVVFDNPGPHPTSGPVASSFGAPRLGNETRPVNIALVYAIKT